MPASNMPAQLLARLSLRMPIAAKMAAAITIILVIGLSVLATVVIGNQQRLIRTHIEEFGQLVNYQLALTATEPMFTDQHYELAALIKRYVESPRVLGAAIYDHEGKVKAAAGFYPRFAALPHDAAAHDMNTADMVSAAPRKQEAHALVMTEPISFRGTTAGSVALILSRQSLDSAQREIVRISVLVALALSIVICAVAIYLGRRLAQPIHSLVDAARLLERGEFAQIPPRGNDEFGQIIKALNVMGLDLVRKAQVEDIMRRVLARDVANKLLDEIEPVKVGGDRVEATVMFADIAGFTTLSEHMSPEAVSQFLNEYFHYIDACAHFYFGTIDKFIGDGVMVLFGAPNPNPDHHYHAVACAVLMQRLLRIVNAERAAQQLPIAELRIGINSGTMLAGLIGSQQRMEYTVVGDAVNLASRLCNEARAGQIIIEGKIYDSLKDGHAITVDAARQINVRGKSNDITIYTVTDIDHSHPQVIEQLIDDIMHNRKAS